MAEEEPSDGEATRAWKSKFRVFKKPSKFSSQGHKEFNGATLCRLKSSRRKSTRERDSVSSSDNDGDDDTQKEVISDERALVSSTNTLTAETFSEEELYLKQRRRRPSLLKRKDWTSVKGSRKIEDELKASLRGAARFIFQKRKNRIDWRSLHAIDVEQIFRETDIKKLETILDTIAFGDVLGEDTRNFTEQNFMKLFRLSQLMIEYLLHVQETLGSHKKQLLEAGASLQKRGEKLRLQCLWQHDVLKRTRHELKHAKKTLNTYEVLLRTNWKASSVQQVHHCPFCEKVFESVHFVDLHISRRHPKSMENMTEDKILEIVSKAEEATFARVKVETSTMLQAELQRLRAALQVYPPKDDAASNAQVSQVASLQIGLAESNNKLQEVQHQLKTLQSCLHVSAMDNSRLKKELDQTNLEAEEGREVYSEQQHARGSETVKEHPQERDEAISEDTINTEADTVDHTDDKRTRQAQHLDFKSKEEGVKSTTAKRLKRDESPDPGRAVAANALADIELDMPLSDKEKWMRDHPCAPLPRLPYSLSKYPHQQTSLTKAHERISQQFVQNLADELEKFGIPPNAEGISDDKFAAATAALERRRTARFSSAPTGEQRIMEYERSTILWHIERAVHSRGMGMVESIVDGETDSGSEASDGQINLYDINLSDMEDIQQAVSINERPSSRETGYERKEPLSRHENMYSPVEPEPGSEGLDVETLIMGHQNSGLTEENVLHTSKTFSWKTAGELEAQTFKVTGHVVAQRIKSPIADQHHFILSPVASPKVMANNEDKQVEDNMGLGEWESEDGRDISPRSMSLVHAMRKGVLVDHTSITSPRSSFEQVANTSRLADHNMQPSLITQYDDEDSEGSKILDELDAEINEIMKL
ncbi:hypothetical protein O6H91_18G026000 [Diphasiastrum complanatum]|uniref:Uncharacterized protein n=1 Tax=Diphasiastrum complanatum TaxID=34168 RepID=A0ACC2AZ25_DIPCM|nr:hypothetical protein O6H91_18G026000 [Diphasiastrum complanatum]